MGNIYGRIHSIPLTLEHCPELCRLEIFNISPKERERAIISSVTSINLRTIAFLGNGQGSYRTADILEVPSYWEPLDDTLRELVDKLYTLGYKHTLELEFHLRDLDFYSDQTYPGRLVKFREMGRVKIFGTSSRGVAGEDVVNLPVSVFLS